MHKISAKSQRLMDSASASEKIQQLIHELEVHQLELEMQNEELRIAQEKLDESLARYENLFDLAPVGYLVLNPKGRIVNANLTVATFLKTERVNLSQRSLNHFITPDYQDVFLRHLRATFKGSHRQTCNLELIGDDGNIFIAQMTSVAQGLDQSSEPQCLTVCTDITEQQRQEALIHRQANYDFLTDLPNRLLFMDRLAYTLQLAGREQTELALFFIDLDHFKGINDTYGHAVGDQVLKETARRLTVCARKNDTVARWSGDEFCMLLPRVSGTASASCIVRKVMEVMEAPIFLPDGNRLDSACSIGIALYPKDGENSEQLLNHADVALYRAKRAGRRQFVFFSEMLDGEMIRRQRQLNLELKNAVLNNQFRLYFQPIFDLNTASPYGAEVLVRWQHPDYGLLPPGDFIALAEANGAIVDLGEWVLQTAVQQMRAWQRAGAKLTVFWINLSARQCANHEQMNRLEKLFDELTNHKTGLPRLGLEITESEVLDLSKHTSRLFEALHRRGIVLAIDDFGTGYSSLKRLLHLPIDFLKVDRSFIADIEQSEKSVNLVKTIVALGHSINAGVVAEGIETDEQLQIVRRLGCDFAQGFYLSRPLSGDRFAKFLGRQ